MPSSSSTSNNNGRTPLPRPTFDSDDDDDDDSRNNESSRFSLDDGSEDAFTPKEQQGANPLAFDFCSNVEDDKIATTTPASGGRSSRMLHFEMPPSQLESSASIASSHNSAAMGSCPNVRNLVSFTSQNLPRVTFPVNHGGRGTGGGSHSNPESYRDSLHSDDIGGLLVACPSTPPSRTPTTAAVKQHEGRVQEARLRALQARKTEMQRKSDQLNEGNQKQLRALERRQFYESHHHVRRLISWLTFVQTAISGKILLSALERRRSRPPARPIVFPTVAIRLRRLLRTVRGRILGRNAAKPQVASLRFDRIFNLFPDDHLKHAVECMKLRYYFENETIIFIGSEDDEAYVLHQGSADVMMGPTKVFGLKAGMTFGTVGMISGEPRTASIVAREPCLVWVITRKDFNAHGNGAGDEQLKAAHAALNELRQANIFNVYKQILEAHNIANFAVFRGLLPETLSNLVKLNSKPMVVRCGTVIASPATSVSRLPVMLLLRGQLNVSVHRNALIHAAQSTGYSFADMLRHVYDVPRRAKGASLASGDASSSSASSAAVDDHPALRFKKYDVESLFPTAHSLSLQEEKEIDPSSPRLEHSATSLSFPHVVLSANHTRWPSTQPSVTPAPQMVTAGEKDGDATMDVVRISAPALLFVAPMLLSYHVTPPFSITTATDCDALSLSRETFRQQDVLELAVIKQNSLNLHCEFVAAVQRSELIQWLIQDIKCNTAAVNPVLQALRSATDAANTFLKEERWVYAAQDFMCFEPQSAFLINIVLDGELELSNSQPTLKPPLVWPPIAQSFFASTNMTIRVKSRANVLRIRRQDLIAWMCRSLRTPELRTLVSQLASQVISTSSKVPTFSQFGLDDECTVMTGTSLKSMRRTSSGLNFRGGGGGGSSSSVASRKRSVGQDATVLELILPTVDAVIQQMLSNNSVSSRSVSGAKNPATAPDNSNSKEKSSQQQPPPKNQRPAPHPSLQVTIPALSQNYKDDEHVSTFTPKTSWSPRPPTDNRFSTSSSVASPKTTMMSPATLLSAHNFFGGGGSTSNHPNSRSHSRSGRSASTSQRPSSRGSGSGGSGSFIEEDNSVSVERVAELLTKMRSGHGTRESSSGPSATLHTPRSRPNPQSTSFSTATDGAVVERYMPVQHSLTLRSSSSSRNSKR